MMLASEPRHRPGALVFLDLETTGLLAPEITELSMVGFLCSDFINVDQFPLSELPRVCPTLTMYMRPSKPISESAAAITHLTTNMLDAFAPFGPEHAQQIALFLQMLPQPVVFVAHNGLRFDFPILRASLLNIQHVLPPDILCIDSLTTLPQLDAHYIATSFPSPSTVPQAHEGINQNEPQDFAGPSSPAPDLVILNNPSISGTTLPNNASPTSEVQIIRSGFFGLPKTISIITPPATPESSKPVSVHVDGEKNLSTTGAQRQVKKQLFVPISNGIDVTVESSVSVSTMKAFSVQVLQKTAIELIRQFADVQRAEVRWNGSDHTPEIVGRNGKWSYSMKNVYWRLFGQSIENAHKAQGDCVSLAKICRLYGNDFLQFVCQRAELFAQVQPGFY